LRQLKGEIEQKKTKIVTLLNGLYEV
jgi:hypothetical protein